MRRIIKIFTGRMMLVVPLMLLELSAIIVLLYHASLYYQIMPVLKFLAVLLVIYVINQEHDPAYKIGWCIILLAVPIIGVPLYVLAGNRKVPKKLFNGILRANEGMEGLLPINQEVNHAAMESNPLYGNIFRYGMESGFPVFNNTKAKYYPSGEEWFKDYIASLKEAKHFIFIETFILDEGSAWDEVLAVLKQKVSEGVGVKLIYDDFGSITMPWHYDEDLREIGIEAYRFNHVRPAFIVQMNNRSHRKITVIDNKVAYTGGVNLADEYMNRIVRFGYWKDSAIRLEGDAVWAFTVMFLGMYTFVRGWFSPIDYNKYHLTYDTKYDDGYYQPFADTPTDDEAVALNMHLNMIRHAKKYIYIDTPYLIPTDAVKQELALAAKSGVDVRILVPKIPDKMIVNQITKANYDYLIHRGIRIYEYTPGFDHAKNIVVDDEIAIVGSPNMDYRSYFLNFENGVLFMNSNEVKDVRKDFEESLKKAEEITEEDLKKTFAVMRLFRAVLNILVPLV